MLQSPAKRRKISPTRSVAADVSNTQTTPVRASYASPTKASLARSHPNILSRSPGRGGQATDRGEVLRQELQGQKDQYNEQKHDEISASAPETPRHGDVNTSRKVPATTAPADSFAATLSRAFATLEQSKAVPRPPLATRQPSAQHSAQQPRATSIDDLPAFVMPKLVQKSNEAPNEPLRARSNDIDLPPTPVQLGLDIAPEKPRGLVLSSSPRSSRSGSGKNRRRLRGLAVTSSPLKPKDAAPPPRSTMLAKETRVIEEERPEEAPESEAEDPEQAEVVPEEIKEKQALRHNLQEQLKRLKADMAQLEAALSTPTEHTSAKVDTKLLSLLTTTNPACARPPLTGESMSFSPKFPNQIGLGSKPAPYLTLFAPGCLHLSTKSFSRTSNGILRTTHTLTLTTPGPWPPQMFSAVFEVTINADDAKVESVKLRQPRKGSYGVLHHKDLYNWIYTRLDDALHKFDVGTLVWGMGTYFDECVRRAKSMRVLDRWHQNTPSGETAPYDETSNLPLTQAESQALLPFMASSQIEVTANAIDSSDKRKRGRENRSRFAGPRILMSWTMELDWTGEVKETVDVAASGVPKKAAEGVKAIWATLRGRKGVAAAVGDVLGVLTGEGSEG